ncbi:uncharacterized protein LOC103365651 isoform X1 [Stegastes partitus]|uniref:Uncharacterized protein LOC103365651 isoform X1 n=1 Tax=Stegastes partitus TaxID=144197 RepID=A0A9Y4NBC0_9TELE|nr:PREDICTED: uncharacterized protein LOC103365651 isoform X1 [Stegastes partitus]
MLLLLLTVFTFFFGSSAVQHEACYGKSFSIPLGFGPPLYDGPLILEPSRRGSTRTVMDKGMSMEPRLKVSIYSATLTDLNKGDEGTYSKLSDPQRQSWSFKLKVLDCADEVKKKYGEFWTLSFPRGAALFEFTPPNSVDPPVVLWNRSNPLVKSGNRGRVSGNSWQVSNVAQSENGFYNIRKKDNTLLSRIHLTVKENIRHYHKVVDKNVIFEYPWDNGAWFVTFQPAGEFSKITLIKNGSEHTEDRFRWRLDTSSEGPKIYSLESRNSGTYEFTDKEGNLALVAHLVVREKEDYDSGDPPPTQILIYIGIAALLAVFCCCCFCCKKKCCKKDKSAPQTAAAPAVSYHDESQPVGPSYSAVPSSSFVSHQPTAAPRERQVYYQPTAVLVTPSPLQVAPPGGSAPAPSAASDFLSLDSDPRFELKGLTSSTLPLSSDTTLCSVYTSEKLNFM